MIQRNAQGTKICAGLLNAESLPVGSLEFGYVSFDGLRILKNIISRKTVEPGRVCPFRIIPVRLGDQNFDLLSITPCLVQVLRVEVAWRDLDLIVLSIS